MVRSVAASGLRRVLALLARRNEDAKDLEMVAPRQQLQRRAERRGAATGVGRALG